MMILLILFLSLVVRMISLNQSLWLDEAVQAITAQNSLSYIFQEITGDFHPPLYYFLMHFWVRFFGSSEISLRMPSALFGVGTVYLVYKLGRLRGFGRLGILGAVFLATAPFHIYYSQEARMYSMTTFFSVLSMFYFIKISNIKSPLQGKQISKPILKIKILNIEYILYFISTACLIYSDYYGFLILLAQMIYLVMHKKYKFLLICLFAYLLIYIPWLPMFVRQIKTGMLATQILPGWGKLVNVSFLKAIPLTFIKFTIGRITIFDKRVYALFGGFIIFLYGLLIAKGYFKGRKLLITNYQLLITLWFFVPLLISWITSLFVPNYQPFRLLLILPAFYLLLAMGIEGLERNKWIKGIAIATLLIINFVSLFVYYSNPYFHREDWRRLVKYLREQKDSITFLPSSASNWPIKYYDSEGKVKLQEGVVGIGEIGEIRKIKEDRVYYIRYLVPLFDPKEKILAELEGQGYTKTKEVSFNQIPLWEFEMVTSD